MSAPTEEVHAGEGHGLHPSERQYVIVAAVLAVLTVIEVALYYIEGIPDNGLVAMLGVLAVLKFLGVALYFMHLKFDSGLFSRLFVSGLVLAIVVYLIVLLAMHVVVGDSPFTTIS
jgi:cytochrome c oxidase subunit IV